MNRTKNKQSSYFEGTHTLLPTRKSNLKRNRLEISGDSSNYNIKRERTQLSVQDLDFYFITSMRFLIRTSVLRNDKKMAKDINALKL